MIQQLIINGIIAGSIYSLIALGFSIIYKTVKFFHFAHGIVYTVSAYLAYSFFISFNITFIISFFLSIIFTTTLGILIDKFIYYPLRQQNASNLIFLITSFGVYIFLQNFIQLLYGAQVLTLSTNPVKEGYNFLSTFVTPIQIVIFLVSLVLVFIIWLFIKKTRLGKAIRAVSDDPLAANIVGISSEKIILLAFAIGSALAGVAGILISFETNIEPTMGFAAILKGIIASIIGGIGSIPGSVFGGFLLGIIENLGIWKIQAGWKDCIAFIILLIFLLLKPEGILGIKIEKDRL